MDPAAQIDPSEMDYYSGDSRHDAQVDEALDARSASPHAVQAVRQAEHELERQAWDVHCIEYAAGRAEQEGAKQRAKAADARELLAVKRQALGAILAQFPDVVPEEVDLHGVE